MAVIGELAVNVIAKTSGFVSGMERSRKQLTRYQKQVIAAKRATASFNRALGALGVTIGSAAIISRIKSHAEAIDNLAKTSDKLGIATEKLAALRFAGEQTGVDARTMDMALQRMTRRLAEAGQDAGEAKDAIAELGLSAQELVKLAPDQAFRQIAEAMQRVENQSDRVRLAFKFFDSEGVALVNTLALGSAGLQELEDQAKSLGLAITREEASRVEEFNDALNRMSKAMQGLGNQFVIDVAPAATRAIDDLTYIVKTMPGMWSKFTDEQLPWTKAAWRGLNRVFDVEGKTNRLIQQDIAGGMATGTAAPEFAPGSRQALAQLPREQSADRMYQEAWQQINSQTAPARTRKFNLMIQNKIEDGIKVAGDQYVKALSKVLDVASTGLVDYASRLSRNVTARRMADEMVDRLDTELIQARNEQLRRPRAVEQHNEALIEGTIEAYRALRANREPIDVAKKQLTEAKTQNKWLEKIFSEAMKPEQVTYVMIPG